MGLVADHQLFVRIYFYTIIIGCITFSNSFCWPQHEIRPLMSLARSPAPTVSRRIGVCPLPPWKAFMRSFKSPTGVILGALRINVNQVYLINIYIKNTKNQTSISFEKLDSFKLLTESRFCDSNLPISLEFTRSFMV